MRRGESYIALGAVAVLGVTALNVASPVREGLEDGVNLIFTPFFEVATAGEQLTETAVDRLRPRQVLESRLKTLRQENERLRLRLQRVESFKQENARLRRMLDFREKVSWELEPAEIVGRDPANWWRSLQINLGERDGVRRNMAVVTIDGLVGRISEVNPTRSRVVLLGDPSCRVAARVRETRESGVITPRANVVIDPLEVDFKYLPSTPELGVGDEVVTSGQGGIFPEGLRIGHIADVRSVDYGLYTEARVRMAVNFNRIESVWVIRR